MAERMTIARPYAKAAFEYATASKMVAAWADALLVLSQIAKHENVLTLLHEEMLGLENTVELFLSVCIEMGINAFKDNSTELFKLFSVSLRNFILLLAKRKRLKILPEIELLYKKMQLASENKIEVKFESPTSLDKNQQEAFQKILEQYLGKKAIMTYVINANLIGGFFAKADNFVIDGSVRGSLEKLKSVIGD